MNGRTYLSKVCIQLDFVVRDVSANWCSSSEVTELAISVAV